MAYANSDVIAKSGCFLWFDEHLIDIRQYTDDGQDLYIRMASSEAGKYTFFAWYPRTYCSA
jgi:hypothetical protein